MLILIIRTLNLCTTNISNAFDLFVPFDVYANLQHDTGKCYISSRDHDDS